MQSRSSVQCSVRYRLVAFDNLVSVPSDHLSSSFINHCHSYSLEIIPFALRAKGFTIFGLALSISLVFNQYVNPIALKALAWKYYVCPNF
jgi:hypothetical protein